MADTKQLLNARGANAKPLFCRHCGSQFNSADKAENVEHVRSQSHFQRLADGGSSDSKNEDEKISSLFWKVPDVWDFDNIGQTRAVAVSSSEEGATAETVYIVCADCEKGPVGVRWAAGEPYYVAHSRVQYEKPEGAPEDGALPPGMTEDFVRGLIAQQEQRQQQQQQQKATDDHHQQTDELR